MSDKIKTLSQAIRLGATFRPKCEHALFKKGESCAYGAAYEALTGKSEYNYDDPHPTSFCNRRFHIPHHISNEVVHRNNGQRGFLMQTREAIADWLESIGL